MILRLAFSKLFAIILLTLTILSMGVRSGEFKLYNVVAVLVEKFQNGKDWLMSQLDFFQIVFPSWNINYIEADMYSLVVASLVPILTVSPENYDPERRYRTYRTPTLLLFLMPILLGMYEHPFILTGRALSLTYIFYAFMLFSFWPIFVAVRSKQGKRISSVLAYSSNVAGLIMMLLFLFVTDFLVVIVFL